MNPHQHFREYLELHGYWVLFIGTFLEGESILLMAGFLAFQGYLDVFGVVATAFAGSFLGDQCYYYLGYFSGRSLMRRCHLIARKFRPALRLIEKYGILAAFFSRFTYGFRIVLPIILGITSLAPTTFLWINLASALSWASLFCLVGYLFGTSAAVFLGDVSKHEQHLIVILMGFFITVWLFHRYHAWKLKKPVRERLIKIRALRSARSKQ